jgi:hypothetical protein
MQASQSDGYIYLISLKHLLLGIGAIAALVWLLVDVCRKAK